MYFGCHVSIAGGLDKAIQRGQDLGCRAIQIFASNPRGWRAKPINPQEAQNFCLARQETDIKYVAVHSTYLVNLASPRDEIRSKSYTRLKEDLLRAGMIGADFMVLHPGSHGGAGWEEGAQHVAQALTRIQGEMDLQTRVLLEIEAGAGFEIGSSWGNLAYIMGQVPAAQKWLGVCLDTCHSFAAGYDLRTASGWEKTLHELDSTCGLESLKLIHANDSIGALGGHLDRHTHIGSGLIGEGGFREMMRRQELVDLPVVLETPEDSHGDFATNLATLQKIWQTR